MSAELHSWQRESQYDHDRPNGQRRSAMSVVLRILLVSAIVLCYLPLSTSFPANNLDSAWQWVMNEAVARHMVIGHDVIFTFGPYASVYTHQFHPATDGLDMGGSLVLGLAFGSGLVALAEGRQKWLLVAALVAILLNNTLRDPFYLALPPLLLVLTARIEMRRDSPLALHTSWLTTSAQILLIASLGILPLIKGSFGALSIALAGLCFLLQWRSNPPKAVIGAAIFLAALVGGWAITGQPLEAIPRYFLSMRPIISGYTDAMSTRGGYNELIVYVLSAAFVTGTTYVTATKHATLPGLGLLLGVALALFVTFKAGFVRHDAHALIAFGTLMFIEIFIAFLCSRRLAVVLVVLAIGGYLFADNHYTPLRTQPARMSNVVSAIARGVEKRLDGKTSMIAEYTANVAAIRTAFPLPALPGTWDVYSYSQSILLANNVPWSPRPVFQSYSAYGPELAKLNAAHLRGPSAPDNILFSVSPIDGRLPALEDGLSWLTLVNDYSQQSRIGDYVVLRHDRGASPAALKPLTQVNMQLGQSLPVPPGNTPIWAKLDLTPSIAGRIANVLFAAPEVRIELSFADGRTESYRYIASMGATGFLVSPLIRNTDDFVKLTSADRDQHFSSFRPTSIRIVPARHSRLLWSRHVPVEFSQVEIQGQH